MHETQKYIPRHGMKRHSVNPGIDGLRLEVGNRRVAVAGISNLKVVDDETGQNVGVPYIGQRVPYEKGQFVKVFSQGIREMFALPKTAMPVLRIVLEIYERMPVQSDQLFINYRTADKCGYDFKEKTFYTGINILLDRSILFMSDQPGFYFVNPVLFFKGDRFQLVREYYLASSDTAEKTVVGETIESSPSSMPTALSRTNQLPG